MDSRKLASKTEMLIVRSQDSGFGLVSPHVFLGMARGIMQIHVLKET